MRLKIRCDGECEKFSKIFWELNTAQIASDFQIASPVWSQTLFWQVT